MFVIASDIKQQKYAQFMIKQLKGFPVHYIGIGWEPPKGAYLTTEIPMPQFGKPWCAKPAAILAALHFHKKVIWLDNDIEIVDMYNFKQIWHQQPLALAWDGRANNYNTGVIVAGQENALIINEWCDKVKLGVPDQDAFATIDITPKKLDSRFNSLRLAPTPGAFANHHTGPTGKEQLVETTTWKSIMN